LNGKAWGVLCVAAGLTMSVAGWKLMKSAELPEGTTGFSGVAPNRRGLTILAGNVLLIAGLILAAIIGSFFFIGG
jgi:hypothetical protein